MRPCSATLLDAPPRPAPQVPIPELGAESIQEGSILSILKNAGDYVEAEGVVAEVETDKVTVEAKSPHAGTITAIHVAEGDTVEVGGKFFAVDIGVGEAAAAKPSEAAAAHQPRARTPLLEVHCNQQARLRHAAAMLEAAKAAQGR